MKITNPIYDAVFKFVLEDHLSACTTLSLLANRKIIDVKPFPQESVILSGDSKLKLMRMDFHAVIELEDGTYQKTIVELQKENIEFSNEDLGRYRRYLGKNYLNPVIVKGKEEHLPILAMYLIGYSVGIPNLAIANKIEYRDSFTEEAVELKSKWPELLSHESRFIFIKNLENMPENNKLVQLLSLFNQDYAMPEKRYILESDTYDKIEDKDIKHIANRLHLATFDAEFVNNIEMEEYYRAQVERQAASLRESEERFAQADAIIAQADEKFAKADAIIAQADEKFAKADAIIAQADAINAQADEKFAKADAINAQADEKFAQSDEKIAQADAIIAQADKKIAQADAINAQTEKKLAQLSETKILLADKLRAKGISEEDIQQILSL